MMSNWLRRARRTGYDLHVLKANAVLPSAGAAGLSEGERHPSLWAWMAFQHPLHPNKPVTFRLSPTSGLVQGLGLRRRASRWHGHSSHCWDPLRRPHFDGLHAVASRPFAVQPGAGADGHQRPSLRFSLPACSKVSLM